MSRPNDEVDRESLGAFEGERLESALLVLRRRQHSLEAEGERMKEEGRQEEEDEGEEERGEEEGEEKMVMVSEKALAKKGKVTAVKRSASKKAQKPQLRTVATPVKPMVDGEANAIGSCLTGGDMVILRETYNIPDEVAMRAPMENEVACSDCDSEVCLYDHMFQWGLHRPTDERARGTMFLLAVLIDFKLSPG